jgi:predicted ATPase
VPGEITWRVPSMSLPTEPHREPIEALRQSDAVSLFIDRATQVRPSFVITAGTAPAVIQICRDLDGIPLAIELATARMRMLAPSRSLALEAAEQVCPGERIDRDGVLDLLTGLVDKSLVTTDERGSEMRYRLLEAVRQYATARLADDSEVDDLRDRHLAWPRLLSHMYSARGAMTPCCSPSLPSCRTYVQHSSGRRPPTPRPHYVWWTR